MTIKKTTLGFMAITFLIGATESQAGVMTINPYNQATDEQFARQCIIQNQNVFQGGFGTYFDIDDIMADWNSQCQCCESVETDSDLFVYIIRCSHTPVGFIMFNARYDTYALITLQLKYTDVMLDVVDLLKKAHPSIDMEKGLSTYTYKN